MDYKLCYSYQSTYISLIFTIRRHSIIEKKIKKSIGWCALIRHLQYQFEIIKSRPYELGISK